LFAFVDPLHHAAVMLRSDSQWLSTPEGCKCVDQARTCREITAGVYQCCARSRTTVGACRFGVAVLLANVHDRE
jgi:hypothetical protein